MTDYHTTPRRTNNSTIARIRLERGMTQAALAESVGCLPKDVSRWERGVCTPSAASLIKLANALGCSVDEILSDNYCN